MKKALMIACILVAAAAASAKSKAPKERSHQDPPTRERNEVDDRGRQDDDSYSDSIYEDRDPHLDDEGPNFNEPSEGEGGWESEVSVSF